MATIHSDEYGKVYTRERSSLLWLRFPGRDGREVRRSSGTKEIEEAVVALKREYQRERALTFQLAVVDFFEVRDKKGSLKPATVIGYKSLLRSVGEFFGDHRLSEIDREELKTYVALRRRKVSDTTVRRELAFLSTVFSHAIDHMPNGPEANPVTAFSKRALKETSRDRWLTAGEYDQLLAACWDDMHRHIVTLACHSGMRTGELLALRKPMLYLDRREVLLPGTLTKSGKSRVVPLTDQAVRTLEQVCETAPGDLVFWNRNNSQGTPVAYTSFNRFFRGARRRAGLNDVRFHDLRHTFASWWVQQGGDLYALRKILGHQSMQMVERYAYLDTAATHRAVLKVDLPHTFHTIKEL